MKHQNRFGLSSLALFISAGLACGQVTTGSFTPDATDDYESYGGGRGLITSVFGGTVPTVGGSVDHRSVNQGDWFDFRTGEVVQARSGSLYGVQYGFGSIQYDFTGVGGASGFSGWACAAGAGNDVVEFFDMSGAPMTGTFTKVGGFGAGGVMEQFSFVSPVPIGRIRFTGAETCFDDIAYASAGATVCPTCLADCDGNGTLDFFDFLCFQNLFAAGDLCADCDGSGQLDFFDFLCFQNEFTAGCPAAQGALLYINAARYSHSRTAANGAGLTITEVFDEGSFIATMGTSQHEIAIYENPANFNTPGLAAAVSSFIAGGGKVHLHYWNIDTDPALQAALGIASAIDIFQEEPIFDNAGHPSWGGVASPIGTTGELIWNDNGDYMTAASGATIVATHSSTTGPGATIVANSDSSIVNGWEYDTKQAPGVTNLLQAQLEWLVNP